MKKVFALVLSAVLTVSALAGCGGAPAAGAVPAAGGDTIKLGILAPLTGNVSVYGIAAKNGADLAIEEINAAGGINGKQIEPIVADEKGDPTEASNAYASMSDEIIALIGDVTSKPCMAVAQSAAEDNMPMLTPTGTAADITTYGENVFRTCFMDPFQGQIMAQFAAESLNYKTVAILYNTSDDYSDGIAKSFEETSAALGMTVVAKEGYGATDKDFKAQLTKIAGLNPDALLIPDYYNSVALIASQAREVGYNGTLLGGDGWDGVLGVMDASKMSVLDNSYYSNHYAAADTTEVVVNFFKNYKAKYNADPISFAALGYDSVYMMAKAIETAGVSDNSAESRQAIIDALAKTDYTGVTGQMTFDENRNPIKPAHIIKLLDGKESLEAKLTAK